MERDDARRPSEDPHEEDEVAYDGDADLNQRLQKEGDLILSSVWDHGAPLVGAWTERVYELDSRYYYLSDYTDEMEGPFDSLSELFKDSSLGISSPRQRFEPTR